MSLLDKLQEHLWLLYLTVQPPFAKSDSIHGSRYYGASRDLVKRAWIECPENRIPEPAKIRQSKETLELGLAEKRR
jgi:hypothetical protein